jgi:hypothetical protein
MNQEREFVNQLSVWYNNVQSKFGPEQNIFHFSEHHMATVQTTFTGNKEKWVIKLVIIGFSAHSAS